MRLLNQGVMDAVEVANVGYQSVMTGRRVVIPLFLNQIQIYFARFLSRVVVVMMAQALLQRT